ncbi:MAG: nuclear transport factor 2 family protein [Bernardetiaceae bacterium]|nr:nuclear transport factor 2 family protein [Bernardetiaceae bacterium]
MKSFLFSIAICLLTFFAPLILRAQDAVSEEQQIRQVIQAAYIDGIFNLGDTVAIRSGFHEAFQLLGLKPNDELRILPIEEWLAHVVDKQQAGKYPVEKEKEVSVRFLRIDIVERVASAKIEFLIGGELRYIDFLSLYRFADGWKIMNKVYHELAVE